MSQRLRSHTPGRSRWRVAAIIDQPKLARRLSAELQNDPSVERAQVRALTGSVLIYHAPERNAAEMGSVLAGCLLRIGTAQPDDGEPDDGPASASADDGESSTSSGELSNASALSTLSKLIERAQSHSDGMWRFLLTSSAKRLIEATPPAVIGLAVDVLTNPRASVLARMGLPMRLGPQLTIVGTASLALWGLRSWLAYKERVASTELIQVLQHDLRTDAYAKLQTLDMSVFDSAKIGALSSLIDSDVEEIEGLIDNGVKPFISLGANALVTATSLALVSPRMLLIPAACIPALLLLTISAIRPARKRFALAHQFGADFNSLLVDNIDGMATIRAFRNEEVEAARVSTLSRELSQATVDATRSVSRVTPALEGIVGVGLIASLTVGGIQMRQGGLNAGAYNSLAISLLALLNSVAYIGITVARVQRYLTALDRVFSLLETQPSITDGTQSLPSTAVHGDVCFDSINFSYREGEPVLRDISIHAVGGGTTAIVGGSGAGKTTLLKLLLRFYEPDCGTISLDGHAIDQLRQHDLLSAVAMVNQHTFLFHGTIRENIAYGQPERALDDVIRAAKHAAAHEFIEALPEGYDTVVGHRGAKLSGGQRQRVALARALLLEAPILALDEATSAIDSETEAAIQSSLLEATRGRTRIVVAHRLATIRHADRIYVLHQGEVVEQGTHDELVALDGMYNNLWRIQTGEVRSCAAS